MAETSSQTKYLGLKCSRCKAITETKEPICFSRSGNNKYHITGTCVICNKLKSKVMNKHQRMCLPEEIIKMQIGSRITNNIERNGGILPIIPLIGAIAAGISALTGAAGVTANAVLKSKENAEQARHNRVLEEAVKGSGIEPTEDELVDKSIRFLSGKGFKIIM